MIKSKQLNCMDTYKRKLFLINEIKRLLMLYLIKNKNNNYVRMLFLFFKTNYIKVISTKTRINYRCIVSGRNYGVFNKLNYSRFVFRNNLKLSFLPGFQKN